MTGSSTIIPFQSAPQPKATTAVQSCFPQAAVVADQFTSSRGGGKKHFRSAGPSMLSAGGDGESSRITQITQGAGVAPGPREALSDPIAFNAALHRARDQTAAGASRQSGRALDAGRGVYPVFMIGGRMRSFVCPIEGTRWYSLPSSPEILPRSTAMARVALRRLSLLQRRLASMFQARQ